MQVESFLYLGKTDREQSLQNGTIFDDFTIRMDNIHSGRQKQVIDTKTEGQFYIHNCYNCKFKKCVPRNLLRIAHFKTHIRYKDSTETTYALLNYTKDMKFVLSILNEM